MPRIKPVRIAIRDCIVLIMLVIFNTVHVTDMANNNMEPESKLKKMKDSSESRRQIDPEDYLHSCPTEQASVDCSALNYPCIVCNRSLDCRYGALSNYSCTVRPKVICIGSKSFNRSAVCRFCYQTEKWEHRCTQKGYCNSLQSPAKYFTQWLVFDNLHQSGLGPRGGGWPNPPCIQGETRAQQWDVYGLTTTRGLHYTLCVFGSNCTVSDDIVCLGNRQFPKKTRCAWTGGTRWGTALILALTLGGFGADRFYLGHWQEGIGKLFSFGGLGVWTLVDALLIGIHHLGPADGSLYI